MKLENTSLIHADHLLTATYKLVQDPKLLLGVIDHLHTFYAQALQAVLLANGMRPLSGITGQLEQATHVLSDEQRRAIRRVDRLKSAYEASPVSFRRKEQLVICDDSYVVSALTEENIKKELVLAKDLYYKLTKND